MFPGDSSKWKVEAFLEVKKKYDENVKIEYLKLTLKKKTLKDHHKYYLSWGLTH